MTYLTRSFYTEKHHKFTTMLSFVIDLDKENDEFELEGKEEELEYYRQEMHSRICSNAATPLEAMRRLQEFDQVEMVCFAHYIQLLIEMKERDSQEELNR